MRGCVPAFQHLQIDRQDLEGIYDREQCRKRADEHLIAGTALADPKVSAASQSAA
jgi:hypothetical protein